MMAAVPPAGWAAIISGAALILSALLAAVISARLAAGNAARLSALENSNKALDAERSYVFDAKKRLYSQILPLMFQLGDAGERSVGRIAKMHREAWLLTASSRKLYVTINRLVTPLVIISEIQDRLTSLDLTADETLRDQYRVAREIVRALNAGAELAACGTAISY